jgi:hypothetical protein
LQWTWPQQCLKDVSWSPICDHGLSAHSGSKLPWMTPVQGTSAMTQVQPERDQVCRCQQPEGRGQDQGRCG